MMTEQGKWKGEIRNKRKREIWEDLINTKEKQEQGNALIKREKVEMYEWKGNEKITDKKQQKGKNNKSNIIRIKDKKKRKRKSSR